MRRAAALARRRGDSPWVCCPASESVPRRKSWLISRHDQMGRWRSLLQRTPQLLPGCSQALRGSHWPSTFQSGVLGLGPGTRATLGAAFSSRGSPQRHSRRQYQQSQCAHLSNRMEAREKPLQLTLLLQSSLSPPWRERQQSLWRQHQVSVLTRFLTLMTLRTCAVLHRSKLVK